MKKISLIFLYLFCYSASSLRSNNLYVEPLFANPFESRIGTLYEFDVNKLRLDIGASIDLMEIQKDSNSVHYFGSDFSTYTRLRSEGNLKFPVETSDYLFGVNFSGRSEFFNNSFKSIFGKSVVTDYRVRVSHISSHLVDGLANDSSVLNKKPIVFSREFVDALFIHNIDNLRIYWGSYFIFSSQPHAIGFFRPHIGVDYTYKLSNMFEIKSGWDLQGIGTQKHTDFTFFDNQNTGWTNALQLGILAKTFKNSGTLISFYYINGSSVHGQFYNQYDKYFGIGFQLYNY